MTGDERGSLTACDHWIRRTWSYRCPAPVRTSLLPNNGTCEIRKKRWECYECISCHGVARLPNPSCCSFPAHNGPETLWLFSTRSALEQGVKTGIMWDHFLSPVLTVNQFCCIHPSFSKSVFRPRLCCSCCPLQMNADVYGRTLWLQLNTHYKNVQYNSAIRWGLSPDRFRQSMYVTVCIIRQ